MTITTSGAQPPVIDGAPHSGPAMRTTDVALQHRVEQFLFAEAELLDQHRYDEWLDLLTDDLHYWLPTRMTRTIRERDREVSGPAEGAFINDGKYHIIGRVRRLTSGVAWSEEPPSRTRRILSNVRISPRANGDLDVHTNFLVYRSRLERHQDFFIGERFDVLRSIPDDPYPFRIAARKIVLEQATLLAPSISIFL